MWIRHDVTDKDIGERFERQGVLRDGPAQVPHLKHALVSGSGFGMIKDVSVGTEITTYVFM